MQVNYNISAMIANNALVANDNKLAESIERLSSGLKIANAKDNPSGLAISRRMNAQIKSLGVAKGNSGDAISVIQTADGTLTEVHDILQRMSELAIQAANGTNSDSDLKIIQEEITQLKDEVTRIAEATEFNGQNLLDGTFDYRGYATVDSDTDPDVTINSYSDEIDAGKYYIPKDQLRCEYDKNTGDVTLLDEYGYKTDTAKITVKRITMSQGREKEIDYMYEAEVTVDGDLVKLATRDGKEIQIKINENLDGTRIDMDLTRKGAMTMQVGANEGQTLDIRIPKVTLTNLGIAYVDVSRTYKDDLIDAAHYINNSSMSADDKKAVMDALYYDPLTDKVKEDRYNEDITSDNILNKVYERKLVEAEEKYKKREEEINNDPGLSELEKSQKLAEAKAAYEQEIQEIQETGSSFVFINADDARKIVEANKRYTNKKNDIENDTSLSADEKLEKIAAARTEYENKVAEIMENGNKRAIEAPHSGADRAIEDIGNAIQKISDIRSRLGAYQNRLDHTVSNIGVTSENMTAAYSRIMDVDMADEMTVYSTQQVLSQAGTSMLAQANERPQQVLQLLQ
ncbi:flagellin N-terminal helical domain-containing protein [Butyrivibrio sp. AC2005]|uniref:flagellin N-terminal helical domain-containing protein n=1 Tax=Butyrivibrio sp. AC2005 TaxID=1280672 RepID=UPI00040FF2CD|nr:flagellin [Butyrivibrio sp. AC2005]